jgi:hypothetical protein
VSFPGNPVARLTQAFAVRVRALVSGTTAAGAHVQVPVYIDAFAVPAGAAEVNMSVTRTLRPPPSATESHLLSVLYGRARSHQV